jgi:hypothetical protein
MFLFFGSCSAFYIKFVPKFKYPALLPKVNATVFILNMAAKILLHVTVLKKTVMTIFFIFIK